MSLGVLPADYKFRLCSAFDAHGSCNNGDMCHDAHSVADLRYRIPPLRSCNGSFTPVAVFPCSQNLFVLPGVTFQYAT